jgi:hypothetical protein
MGHLARLPRIRAQETRKLRGCAPPGSATQRVAGARLRQRDGVV